MFLTDRVAAEAPTTLQVAAASAVAAAEARAELRLYLQVMAALAAAVVADMLLQEPVALAAAVADAEVTPVVQMEASAVSVVAEVDVPIQDPELPPALAAMA